MKLSRPAQEKARTFIQEQARPLERALCAYHFAGGAPEPVLVALAQFQNPDGGFGHALEPDFRLPASSAIATTVGLQILRAVQAPTDHPLVRKAVRYLLDTWDPENQVWPIIPPNDNSAPHAPWWGYSADLADQWGGFLANPRAEIAGYLHEHATLVPGGLRNPLIAAVVDYLEETASLDMHGFLCYLRLAETASLGGEMRERLIGTLRPVAERLVCRERDQWGQYGLKPLDVIQSPDSPFAALFLQEIDANLDYLVECQQPDGAWSPTWSWGAQFPETWPTAEREWKGVLTSHTLKILRDCGRWE